MSIHTSALDLPASDHDPVETQLPWHAPGSPLRRIRVHCSCLLWEAEAVVNPAAPAFTPGLMETQLRRLHADHRHDEQGAAAA